MPLYFVYGSLMTNEKALDTGRATFVENHAIRFSHVGIFKWEPSFANLEVSEGEKAWGVVIEFSREEWKIIRKREMSYAVKDVIAVTMDGEELECVALTLKKFWIGRECTPSARYAKMLLDGAQYHNFPEEVIQSYDKCYREGHKASLRLRKSIQRFISKIKSALKK